MTIVPPPLLYTIEPLVVCNGTTREMQLSGANFLSLTTATNAVTLPTIKINDQFTVDQGLIRLADCQTITVKVQLNQVYNSTIVNIGSRATPYRAAQQCTLILLLLITKP